MRIRRLKVCRMNLPKKARVWVRFLDRRVEAAVTKHLKRQEAGATPGATPGRPHGAAATNRITARRDTALSGGRRAGASARCWTS
jgi:hypothetical protein